MTEPILKLDSKVSIIIKKRLGLAGVVGSPGLSIIHNGSKPDL